MTLGKAITNLAPTWFVMRDVHAREGTILLQPRWAMSYLRGPMARNEIRRVLEMFGDDATRDDAPPRLGQRARTVPHGYRCE